MQIAGSNLILAAQAAQQAQRTRPAVAPAAGEPGAFEALNFAKVEAPSAPKPPAGPIQRPGAQLDIKV